MKNKELGFVGLGRMGMNMAAHLVESDYRVVGYNRSEEPREEARSSGIETVDSLKSLTESLSAPRVIWLMVSSSAVDAVLEELLPLLSPQDTVIDGGNSFYQDSIRRHQELADREINYLDCGTSGGMEGARHGASIMVGGSEAVFKQYEHIFHALAAKDGYARVGRAGAGAAAPVERDPAVDFAG